MDIEQYVDELTEKALGSGPSAQLADAPEPLEVVLNGRAVELWCDHAGGLVFIVADEEDAREVVRRFGARRGEVWTPSEIELVARIEDQAIREELAGFKRTLNGSICPEAASEGVSPEELKAAALNRLFLEQGASGQPGKITASTIHHGERSSQEKRS